MLCREVPHIGPVGDVAESSGSGDHSASAAGLLWLLPPESEPHAGTKGTHQVRGCSYCGLKLASNPCQPRGYLRIGLWWTNLYLFAELMNWV
jgi:hypothetical protein